MAIRERARNSYTNVLIVDVNLGEDLLAGDGEHVLLSGSINGAVDFLQHGWRTKQEVSEVNLQKICKIIKCEKKYAMTETKRSSWHNLQFDEWQTQPKRKDGIRTVKGTFLA
jgi:hypothetical protein